MGTTCFVGFVEFRHFLPIFCLETVEREAAFGLWPSDDWTGVVLFVLLILPLSFWDFKCKLSSDFTSAWQDYSKISQNGDQVQRYSHSHHNTRRRREFEGDSEGICQGGIDPGAPRTGPGWDHWRNPRIRNRGAIQTSLA